jgi:TRAP-type C4-dicarboxylate transport system permease small subunit
VPLPKRLGHLFIVWEDDMMPILKWIDQNAEKALASVLLAAIVLLISGNVFMRYVMNASLSWGEELTLWLFVWFVWIGVSYAFHTGDHVRITVLRDVLNDRARLIADAVIALLVLGFLLVLTYECVKLIRMPFVTSQSSVVLGLPIPILLPLLERAYLRSALFSILLKHYV